MRSTSDDFELHELPRRSKTRVGGSTTVHSPKRELDQPNHLQPNSPINHLPRRPAVKTEGGPEDAHESVAHADVPQEETDAKPRETATSVCPARLSPPGLWDASGSKPRHRELSAVLKLQPRTWTNHISGGDGQEPEPRGSGSETVGTVGLCRVRFLTPADLHYFCVEPDYTGSSADRLREVPAKGTNSESSHIDLEEECQS
ncbi:hypothetical protein Q5P01_008782 [Channa striata]|uniref:Uncharacterized protein n=1 Tax=Channa striata TaxID=64152 RepID=A0AA88N7C1_CHASR|nr:hypothetical protein Q5P01_008782 [Channa striata]